METPPSASASASGNPPPKPKPRPRARLASHTPGRLRVRVQAAHRQPELLHGLQQRLESQVGRGAVRVNARTGSVLVHYDRHTSSHNEILDILHDVGLLIDETTEGPDPAELDLDPGPGHSKTSSTIVHTMTDLDRRIARATGHQFDLKLLFPAALGGLGVWQVATRGFGFTEVPAYILLWYAFDSFWKFHREPAEPTDADADADADADGDANANAQAADANAAASSPRRARRTVKRADAP